MQIKLPWTKTEPTYSCYWLCLHFPSSEELARYLNDNNLFKDTPESMRTGRMLRGGDKLPKCTR